MRGDTFRPVRGARAVPACFVASEWDDAKCFADEVIVDFPSVAPALDRMRNAFLADDRQTPIGAAIRLTSSDAINGITVPLSVPVRRTCRTCGGRGESWTESCPKCEGSGAEVLRHQLRITVPAGVADGTRLRLIVSAPHHPPTRVELHVDVV
jgi:hypothetical protein